MHSFFAALFSLVFSFSHAASLRQSAAVSFAEQAHPSYFTEYTPTHRELLRAGFGAARYAEAACVSCRKMSLIYRVH